MSAYARLAPTLRPATKKEQATLAKLDEQEAALRQEGEAEDVGDERSEAIYEALDAIADQLSSAYGLAGREKRTGSATERARTNARRRLADAMKRIEEAAPAIGRHLGQTIRTGVLCVYDAG